MYDLMDEESSKECSVMLKRNLEFKIRNIDKNILKTSARYSFTLKRKILGKIL